MNAICVSCQNKNIYGEITLSGSKSISNRVLLIQALSSVQFNIENLSDSDDTKIMQYLLQSDKIELDAHHAGTTYRFLTAYLATKEGSQWLSGSERMTQRPVKALVDALNYLGANIEYVGKVGYPPLKISTPESRWKHEISLPADISSQFISALLLIAPTLTNGLIIHLEGNIVSRPYIEMTISIMNYFDINVHWEDQTITIVPQKYQPKDFYVEADWSAASYYYTIAAFSESADIVLKGLHQNSIQGDSAIVEIGNKFGIETIFGNQQIRLVKKSKYTIPDYFEYDFIKVPDLTQSVSVMCAGLGTTALFSGLQTLRIKETDRIIALQKEHMKMNVFLNKLPARFSKKSEIEYFMQEGKSELNAGEGQIVETYQDHRMAMAFAPLGLFFPVNINEPKVISKSYPSFWKDLITLGFNIKQYD